ncbi:MAG TPA: hypothetical protein VFO19_10910 [Vicinamibacterales bacterium]|nr:hypothetical protein [Vicinamibacterales bacterium]
MLTATLWALSRRGEGKIDVFHTIFVRGRTATATVALSAFTNGEENGQLGSATAIITKAGVVTGPGRTDTLPLDPIDILRNQIRIPNCSFVTFRMGVQMAEAIAVASVFVEGAPVTLSTRMHSVWIVDKGSGRVRGLHKIALPHGTRLPSEALLLRRVRECAAHAFDEDTRTLSAVRASRSPALISSGLILDRATGRVRRVPGQSATQTTLASVFRKARPI